MKCLTVLQPWASLIFFPNHPWGVKSTENRCWFTRYRGPLLIHAGKRQDKDGWGAEGVAREAGQTFPAMPRGALLGMVMLVGCDQEMRAPWDVEGQWHWRLERPRQFFPFPYKGRQGLFNVPEEIVAMATARWNHGERRPEASATLERK